MKIIKLFSFFYLAIALLAVPCYAKKTDRQPTYRFEFDSDRKPKSNLDNCIEYSVILSGCYQFGYMEEKELNDLLNKQKENKAKHEEFLLKSCEDYFKDGKIDKANGRDPAKKEHMLFDNYYDCVKHNIYPNN